MAYILITLSALPRKEEKLDLLFYNLACVLNLFLGNNSSTNSTAYFDVPGAVVTPYPPCP